MARVLLIVVLAFLTISFVMGVGTPDTGPLEKGALLILIGACVYAAAKVSALAEWAMGRLTHR